MLNVKTILIASTSKAMIDFVCECLEKINAANTKLTAMNDGELQNVLLFERPYYLLIESCFYHFATPQEMLRLIKRYNSLRIIVFGSFDYTDKFLRMFFRVGVEGYLDMRKGIASFMADLKLALAGKFVIPPQFDETVFDCLPSYATKLTDRDMELIHLVIEGLDNNGIAETLNIKLQTVKNRRKVIYEKLKVTNAVGMVKQLMRQGVIGLDEFLAM